MEIYALVGESGTGKSHRAAFVASEYHIDLIIDDGLLIKGGNILGGMSAKRAPTRMGAVRTALFTDDNHTNTAIDIINRLNPEKILILGTSLGMIERIANRLKLPGPERVITIDEIATTEDIETARYIRNTYGKHVIPVPTAEVSRTYPGLFMDSVNVFLRLKDRPKPKKAVEKTLVRPTYFLCGKISIADNVIKLLVNKSIEETQAPVRSKKVTVQQNEEGVRLELTMKVKYGLGIPGCLKELQKIIKEKIEYLTGLDIIAIDILVDGIDTSGLPVNE
ncbi:MAG TPA: Asp23/Gls24 family envelope stress response protein [Desulfobacteria bacterium]|nr:Asp23/Gls24 family envelope stress response protein [Desulfobacteria bacterium]